MTVVCAIIGAETEVTVEAIKTKTSTPLETLRWNRSRFVRTYQQKFPGYIKELLTRKHFSFVPQEIKNRAYRDKNEYKLNFQFDYEDARTTTLQRILRRVSRWKIIATDIQVVHNGDTNETKLMVKMTIMESLRPTRSPLEELPEMEVSSKFKAQFYTVGLF